MDDDGVKGKKCPKRLQYHRDELIQFVLDADF